MTRGKAKNNWDAFSEIVSDVQVLYIEIQFLQQVWVQPPSFNLNFRVGFDPKRLGLTGENIAHLVSLKLLVKAER